MLDCERCIPQNAVAFALARNEVAIFMVVRVSALARAPQLIEQNAEERIGL
jgi:hypothetical protein